MSGRVFIAAELGHCRSYAAKIPRFPLRFWRD